MKKTRKIAAFAAAMAMAATMAMPMAMSASAAKIEITGISESVNHTFEVYQVATGTLDGDDLVDLKWGSGITAFKTTSVTSGADISAADIALLEKYGSDIANYTLAATATKTGVSSSGTAVIDGLADGYYIVKDVTAIADKDDARSSVFMRVAGDDSIAIKNVKPTVDKQVVDETEDAGSETGAALVTATQKADGVLDGKWSESADHAINETFQFKLTATINADTDLAAYSKYKLVFNDSMSKGVTFDGGVKVYINGKPITTGFTAGTATTDTTTGITTWALTIDDLKTSFPALGEERVVVDVIYNAHLNPDAVLDSASRTGGTSDTNNNMVYLQYSNNPNYTGVGDTGSGDENGEEDTLGKTTEDYVWVFTYKVDNTKYEIKNTAGNELAGAEFSLHVGTASGDAIKFAWNAAKNAYVPSASGDTKLTSQDDGTFNIIGLDAGTYVLVEDNTPDDSIYNKVDNIDIVIGATHAETAATAVSLTLSDATTGLVNTPVDSKKSSLPTTGGMGTSLFVLGGGCMAGLAGIYLISKKRSKDAE